MIPGRRPDQYLQEDSLPCLPKNWRRHDNLQETFFNWQKREETSVESEQQYDASPE